MKILTPLNFVGQILQPAVVNLNNLSLSFPKISIETYVGKALLDNRMNSYTKLCIYIKKFWNRKSLKSKYLYILPQFY